MSTVFGLICLGPSFQKMTHHFLLHGSLWPTNLEKIWSPVKLNKSLEEYCCIKQWRHWWNTIFCYSTGCQINGLTERVWSATALIPKREPKDCVFYSQLSKNLCNFHYTFIHIYQTIQCSTSGWFVCFCLILFFTSHHQSFSYRGTGLPGLNQY